MRKLPRAPRVAGPLLVLASACAVTRPSELPRAEAWVAAVKSAGIPGSMPWYSRFAEHTWVDVKCGDDAHWIRSEVIGAHSGACCETITAREAYSDWRWMDEVVRVHRVVVGESARRVAERIAAVTAALAPRYKNGGYEAWPGPNSNTFMRDLARELPEFAFVFDHNAVGKDYTWLDAGWSPSRTGVSFDTWPLGATLALEEGVELHFLQLTFGVRLWPPRLELPFLPPIPWESEPQPSPAELALR
jgi:hypothetical protein